MLTKFGLLVIAALPFMFGATELVHAQSNSGVGCMQEVCDDAPLIGGLRNPPFIFATNALHRIFNQAAEEDDLDIRMVLSRCETAAGSRCHYRIGEHTVVIVLGPTEGGKAKGVVFQSRVDTEARAEIIKESYAIVLRLTSDSTEEQRVRAMQRLFQKHLQAKAKPRGPQQVCENVGPLTLILYQTGTGEIEFQAQPVGPRYCS